MSARSTGLHAMFVHAHPDDESSKGSATMARYVKEGYRVSVVTLTDGGAGDILNPAMDRPGVKERMLELRREEIAAALEILGVTEHYALGYPDSGWVDDFTGDGSALAADCFYNLPLADVLAEFVPILRATRPQVVVTYDENGGYPHPDHLRTHQVAVAALDAAADPRRHPDAGPPWHVTKLYYFSSFNLRRLEALHRACLDLGLDSPFHRWLERRDRSVAERITTSVDIGDFIGTRSRALLAHRTQIDPDSMWFQIPDDKLREVYPWEDYRLARTEVVTPRPETSLFDGLE